MNEEVIKEKVEVCATGCCKSKTYKHSAGNMGCVYGLGFIGAAIYFIQNADTFWIGVLGILKALVWPALLAHKLLEFLAM